MQICGPQSQPSESDAVGLSHGIHINKQGNADAYLRQINACFKENDYSFYACLERITEEVWAALKKMTLSSQG